VTTPWRKVARDLWQERTRTALVVLAIAIGISGFATVLSTYAVLTRELNEGYRATNPASATLWIDRVDDGLLKQLLSNHGLAEAEARRTLAARIKAGPGEWRTLQLFVVEDYGRIRVSKLFREIGAWPPSAGEILIERDALPVARATIGDPVTVRTAGGIERTLRLSGTVHDVGQAQARMENIVYGYITLATLAQLGEEPYLDQLEIVVAGNAFDEKHVREVATGVKSWLESEGHPVRRMDVPVPGHHPHADIMGLLLLVQAAFGLLALALSGVLVVNLLSALMASQVRQIGVMKAIGGARSQIARIYLAQALLLGAAALVVAVPAGMLGCRVLGGKLAVFLNFDIRSFAVPSWVYLLEALAGLVVPLLAAAYPVWKGSGLSVREALVDVGVGQSGFGASGFDRRLAGLRGLGRPFLLALRNSFRRRTRLALTLVTLATGGVFFLSALNVRASLVRTLDRSFDSMKFDLIVSFGQAYPFEKIERAALQTAGVVGVEGWIVTAASLVSPEDPPVGAALDSGAARTGGGHPSASLEPTFPLVALPAPSTVLAMEIVEGRGLRPDDTNALVLNSQLAAKGWPFKVGNEVRLRIGHRPVILRIVGQAREPFTPALGYLPLRYLEELNGQRGVVSSVRLRLRADRRDPAALSAAKASLDRSLEEEGLRALAISTKAERRFGFDQHMAMIYWFLVVVSGVLAAVGGLGLATTMSINVLERRREMGVLRAIGARPVVVWLIVVGEGAFVGLASFALAAVVAWPVSQALGNALVTLLFSGGLDFYFEPMGLLIWLAASLFLATAACLLPAWHASRGSIREALGYP
jgi:putative ABC transport system permease protein